MVTNESHFPSPRDSIKRKMFSFGLISCPTNRLRIGIATGASAILVLAALTLELFGQSDLESQLRGDWLSGEHCSEFIPIPAQSIKSITIRAGNLIEWHTAGSGISNTFVGRFSLFSPSIPEWSGRIFTSLVVAPVACPDPLSSAVRLLHLTNVTVDFDCRFSMEYGPLLKAETTNGEYLIFLRNTAKLRWQRQDVAGSTMGLSLESPFLLDYGLERSTNLAQWSFAGMITNRNGSWSPGSDDKAGQPPLMFYRAVLLPELTLQKSLIAIPCANDFITSDDGEWAWTLLGLGSEAIFRFDTRTGLRVERFGPRDSTMLRALYQEGRLAVFVDTSQAPVSPRLMLYDTEPNLLFKQEFLLADWRLYRVSAASITSDKQTIWVSSAPAMSSLYGRVGPALFRVNLVTGALQQILGPPPDQRDESPGSGWLAPMAPMVFSLNAQDEVVVFDPGLQCIRWFSQEGVAAPDRLPMDFLPTLAPARVKRFLPLVGGKAGAILDTVLKRVVSRFELPGDATAVCVNPAGSSVMVATVGSSKVLQIGTATGGIEALLDLSRPGGLPGIADASQGKEVADIVKLEWLDNPPRLLALGCSGYTFIVAAF